MKKTILLLLLVLCTFGASNASVITLKNGKVVQGEVLVNNDEVVIVRDNSGARFQYPASEVVSIVEQTPTTSEKKTENKSTNRLQGKKTMILVDLGVGGAIVPQDKGGAYLGGELMLGSRYIGKKHIFVGGGLSVHAMMTPQQNYTFLPLQIAVKVPFLEGKHSPFVGAAFGYGFALSSKYQHGLYTYAQIGYRYRLQNNAVLMVGVKAQFQQTAGTATETIENANYPAASFIIKDSGLSLVTVGMNIGFAF